MTSITAEKILLLTTVYFTVVISKNFIMIF